MNREVEFCGREIGTNKWLYGPLIWDNKKQPAIATAIDYAKGIYTFSLVDPKTVGQYSGLQDCNGKKIYEGSVYRCVDAPNEKAEGFSVFYFNGAFCGGLTRETSAPLAWDCNHNGDDLLPTEISWLEVTGNVHDAPYVPAFRSALKKGD